MENIEEKKQQNICEYIIHMYQTEDLLRVYEMDIDKIETHVIHHLPVEAEEKIEFRNWYLSIKEEMEKEDVVYHGHLSRVQAHVDELTMLHHQLLEQDKNYITVYKEAEPFINHHIQLSEGKIDNPIQVCLNGVYGLLLLRLNGKQVEEDLMKRLDHFGNVLSYLSMKYKQD